MTVVLMTLVQLKIQAMCASASHVVSCGFYKGVKQQVTFEVTEGHWHSCHLTGISFPISLPCICTGHTELFL